MNDSAPNPPTLDIVILTAGESRRLGQPKQHVILAAQSLLERAAGLACDVREALGTGRAPIVISGAYLQQDCIALAGRSGRRQITHHYNTHWKQGMGTSLDCARPLATADGVLVLLVDQYRVTFDHLMAMHALWSERPLRAVAATYANTLGPPVIWPRRLWAERDSASGGHTPLNKSVLASSHPQLVDMPDANIDLDTSDDLDSALANT